MRLTALTPAPPTPITRSCGLPTGPTPSQLEYGRSRTAGSTLGGAIRFSGRSEEKAWRSRSCGDGIRGASAAGDVRDARFGCSSTERPSPPAAASRPSISVLRNRAARGPSRMLARLLPAIREHLLRQLTIAVGCRARRVVLQHRHTL